MGLEPIFLVVTNISTNTLYPYHALWDFGVRNPIFRPLNLKNLMMQFCRESFEYEMCVYGFLEKLYFIFKKLKQIRCKGAMQEMTYIFMQINGLHMYNFLHNTI